MNHFRHLMLVAFASGAMAGFILFVVQRFTVIPLIEAAETYETAAQQAHSDAAHDEQGWQPADGWQRMSFTAVTTMLSAIGFAGILFGFLALSGKRISARLGALWGLAAFACFSVAPALGLPPQPPGVAVAGLYERQIWWIGTALATALGLWLIVGHRRTWLLRVGGVGCLTLPHLVGAPVASGQNSVPAELVRQFAITSLATSGVFWLLLGTIGGFIYDRSGAGSD
jgi:cobalt transporter subunit CbtA